MRLRALTSTLCALALMIAISACGGGGSSSDNGVASKSPQQIVTAATQAIDSVKSVHVSGSTTSGSTPVSLDLSLVSGQGGKGQMSIGGASFQIVATGQTVYIKAGASFWQRFANAQAARVLADKWLKAPASGQFAAFASLTNLTQLFNQLLSTHGTLQKGSTTTINGKKAIAVTDKTRGGTLYVATTGKPYPLKITKGGTSGGTVTFDQINQPITLSAPSGAIAIPH
jgi:hypothetical protein